MSFDFDRKCLDKFTDLAPNIVEKFWKYHEENPHVFEILMKFAMQIKRSGRNRYSIVSIFERVRWHYEIETTGDEFKINNSYRSCYSRLLIMKDPSFDGFFETRVSPGFRRRCE
jgi:hypothetical protein